MNLPHAETAESSGCLEALRGSELRARSIRCKSHERHRRAARCRGVSGAHTEL